MRRYPIFVAHRTPKLAAFLVATLAAPSAWVQGEEVNKQSYHLFNPVPPPLMRELSTDRPDMTESPYTVDAGHFQVEIDLASLVVDQGQRSVGLMSMNTKVGLTNFMDLQVVIDSFLETGGRYGVGDLTLRTKFNVWGNDGGTTAFGLMPFLTLPTGSNEFGVSGVEGGLIPLLAIELPAGFSTTFMPELDLVRNDEGRYELQVFATGTLSHDLYGALGGFVEGTALIPASGGPVAVGLDLGLTYGLLDDLAFDAGVRIGLTDAAEDLAVFTGLSFRI